MYAKGRQKGTIRFSISPGDAGKKIALAGSFNNWVPKAMRKQKDGSFACTVELSPGTYEYKFVVDGQWVVDPDTNAWAMNNYGTFNSVAQVE